LKVIGVHSFLDGIRELKEAMRHLFNRMLKDSEDKPRHEKIIGFFGDRVC